MAAFQQHGLGAHEANGPLNVLHRVSGLFAVRGATIQQHEGADALLPEPFDDGVVNAGHTAVVGTTRHTDDGRGWAVALRGVKQPEVWGLDVVDTDLAPGNCTLTLRKAIQASSHDRVLIPALSKLSRTLI